jgi:hypothetical protein
MPTLADIYSYIDTQKRKAANLIRSPGTTLQEMVALAGDEARQINRQDTLAVQGKNAMLAGRQPTSEQMAAMDAMRQRAENLAMGFAGSTSPLVRSGNPIQSAVVLIGDKIFTGKTHSDALQRAIYEGVVRKESGKLVFPKNAEINSDLFMTKDGRIIDRLDAYKMFDVGAAETAIEKGLMQSNPSKSMTVNYYMEEAKKLRGR